MYIFNVSKRFITILRKLYNDDTCESCTEHREYFKKQNLQTECKIYTQKKGQKSLIFGVT